MVRHSTGLHTMTWSDFIHMYVLCAIYMYFVPCNTKGHAQHRPTYDGPKWVGARRSCIVWATEGESVQAQETIQGSCSTVVGIHLLNKHPGTMLQEYTCTTGIKAGLCLLTNNWILLLYLKPAGASTFAERRSKGQAGWAKDHQDFCSHKFWLLTCLHVCRPSFFPFEPQVLLLHV